MKISHLIILISIMAFSIGLIPVYAVNIVIIEMESNPAGTDAGNEWARLFNFGKDSVNLSGWSINSTHGEIKSYNLSGNISACKDKVISFPTQFMDDENESLVLYDDTGKVVDSTSKITDKVDNSVTWKTKAPRCEFVQKQSSESESPPKTKLVVDPVVETIKEKAESAPERVEESRNNDALDPGVSIQMNESYIEELNPILPYLAIVIAGISGGVIVIIIKSNRKTDKDYEKPDKSVIEKVPMMQKFQDMQTDTQSDYMNNLKPKQVIENKLQIISKLQEYNIGNNDKLEEIKKSLIKDGSFTKEDYQYLETKYEEYKKIAKKD